MAEQNSVAEAPGTQAENHEAAATEHGADQYPDPRSLETVVRHDREHGRAALLRFLAGFQREDFVRPLDCLGGGSVRDRLVHMVDTEGFWMSILQNRVHAPLRPSDYADVDAVLPAWREATDRTVNILHTVDRDWFVRGSLFALPGRDAPLRLVPAMVVMHVLTHEYHHKGQICSAARIMGYTPPDLDFI